MEMNFNEMFWAFKIFIYPISTVAFLGIIMYIGKFFCFGVCESTFDDLQRQDSDTIIFVHLTLILSILTVILWWSGWLYQLEPLIVVMTLLGTFPWIMGVLLVAVSMFHPDGIVFKPLYNLHKRIHQRKHGN